MPRETTTIQVEHNIEVGHRLTKTPGKCLNIHGHSMWVELELWGIVDDNGVLEGIQYGDLKRKFRGHLDADYDHRTLLNHEDEFVKRCADAGIEIPGLALCKHDPTTENIARWIGSWAVTKVATDGEGGIICPKLQVVVHETKVNVASWQWEV